MTPTGGGAAKAHCGIEVILAREAPVAMVLRRGPSKWTQLLRWDTARDTFDSGQWFRGRIYERRCDLSPSGELFVYFASKLTGQALPDQSYTQAWTAVSRPPYLTALALWPKGDCWHGGGLFESSRRLWLNHAPDAAVPHPDHQPKFLEVVPHPGAAGEDWPVWSRRMTRDGWKLLDAGSYPRSRDGWAAERPETWERSSPTGEDTLVRRLDAVDFSRAGGPYHESFTVHTADGREVALGQADWADWDQRGRLVFARGGCVWAGAVEGSTIAATLLADLSDNAPESLEAPTWATTWTSGGP